MVKGKKKGSELTFDVMIYWTYTDEFEDAIRFIWLNMIISNKSKILFYNFQTSFKFIDCKAVRIFRHGGTFN